MSKLTQFQISNGLALRLRDFDSGRFPRHRVMAHSSDPTDNAHEAKALAKWLRGVAQKFKEKKRRIITNPITLD